MDKLADMKAAVMMMSAGFGPVVAHCETVDELNRCEADLLGRQSPLAVLSRQLKSLDPADRPQLGEAINAARALAATLIEKRRAELAEQEFAVAMMEDRLDLGELVVHPRRGFAHLITQTRQELEDVFVGMGLSLAEGPEVETDWYNFEALNFPRGHPARAAQDSFFLDLEPAESVMLRTHTSPVQIRLLQSKDLPVYAIMPGRVYRRDTPDARHTPAFHQIEGLVVDTGTSFAELAGTIDTFTRAYFGPDIESRLRPAFFPFTEPSAEFEITCTICRGSGCRTCSGTGWVELGGCGMVHPNVLLAASVDPEKWSGFAFGFGIDRCAQMRHRIADMRVMLTNDYRFLSQF